MMLLSFVINNIKICSKLLMAFLHENHRTCFKDVFMVGMCQMRVHLRHSHLTSLALASHAFSDRGSVTEPLSKNSWGKLYTHHLKGSYDWSHAGQDVRPTFENAIFHSVYGNLVWILDCLEAIQVLELFLLLNVIIERSTVERNFENTCLALDHLPCRSAKLLDWRKAESWEMQCRF